MRSCNFQLIEALIVPLGSVNLSFRHLWLRMEVQKMDYVYVVIMGRFIQILSSQKIIWPSLFLTVRHRYIYVGCYRWPHNLYSVQYGVSELRIDISNPAAIGSYVDGFDINSKYG
jgi:hypothetical protein